jgi:ribosomal protein L33
MAKRVNLVCTECGKTYEREYKKQRTKFFCSKFCRSRQGRLLDPLSPFRRYVRFARFISKKNSRKTCNITAEYLKSLYEAQGGICPMTGWKLLLPRTSNTHYELFKKGPYNASLDRIDNSKGYDEGNVRFVSLVFNYARNVFSDQEVIDFCKAVANHRKTNTE